MTDYSELKRLAEGAVHAGDHWGLRDSFERQLGKLVDPETVLALIADADQSEQDYKDVVGTIELRDIEISRLKAENAGLKTGYEAYERVNAELKAEIDRLNDEYDKAWRHDLNDKKNVQVLAAEVARLSAESEALREAAVASREFIMHEAEVRGLLDESNEVSFRHPRRQAVIATIDAAMGKGEQS